jgi:thiamine-phosphate pyrophosphorylase
MATSPQRLEDRLSVYLVADPDQIERDLLKDVEAALSGGVTAVQLHAKSGSDGEKFRLASNLASLCAKYSALFIVNDRLDIALAVGADGVHLGTDDLPVFHARSAIQDELVIGYSPADDDEAQEAEYAGANYLGIGPVFGTQSKADAGDAIGLAVLSRRAGVAGIPCIGIGGIDANNASSVIESGAVGVAVMSAIFRAPDPEKAAWSLASAVQKAKSRENRPA